MTSFLFVNRDENGKPVNELTSQLGTDNGQYKMWIDIGSKELKVGILGKDGKVHIIAFKHLFHVFGGVAKDTGGNIIKNRAGRDTLNTHSIHEVAQLEALYLALCTNDNLSILAPAFYAALDACLIALKSQTGLYKTATTSSLEEYFKTTVLANTLQKLKKSTQENLTPDELRRLNDVTSKTTGEYISELVNFLNVYEVNLVTTSKTIAQGGSKFLKTKQHECAFNTHYQTEDTNLAPWRRLTQAIATDDFKKYIEQQLSDKPDTTPIIRVGVGSPAAAMDGSRTTNPIKNINEAELPVDIFDIKRMLEKDCATPQELADLILDRYAPPPKSKRKKSKSTKTGTDTHSNDAAGKIIKLLGLEKEGTQITLDSIKAAIEKTKANQMKKFDLLFMQQDFAQIAKKRSEIGSNFKPIVVLLGPGRLNKTANVVFTDQGSNMRAFKGELDKAWVETNVSENYGDINALMEEATGTNSLFWSEVDAATISANIKPVVQSALNRVKEIKAEFQQNQNGEPALPTTGALTANSAVAASTAKQTDVVASNPVVTV
jgi:hypothetical protein